MRYTLFNSHPSDALKRALERFESGFYQQAAFQFLEILGQDPADRDAAFFYRLIERKFAKREERKTTLVWQLDPGAAWETDWLRGLTDEVIGTEVVDKRWAHIADPMIVVDNRLVPEKTSYYREAFDKGARIILVHLSDEVFRDDTSAYKYCDRVIRCYYNERFAGLRDIFTLPLGYRSDFIKPGFTAAPAASRRHTWGFAGDGKKLTRAEMLQEMGRIANGTVHLTSGFGAPDALSPADYRALLDECVYAPCPSGWSNLESFRVYEALEAGCIPIVEQRPNFDYFTALLGPHPMPTVSQWSDAPALIERLDAAATERLRLECVAWWADYKPKLKARLTDFISRAFATEAANLKR
jgi:hypothetical protein